MILKELITQARTILNDFSYDYWSEEDYKKFVNSSQLKLITLLPKEKFPELISLYTFTHTTGQSNYPLPADFYKEYFVKFLYWLHNVICYIYATRREISELYKYSFFLYNESELEQAWYYIDSNKIFINPYFYNNSTIELQYMKKPKKLINDTDECDFKDKYFNILVYLTVNEILNSEKKENIDTSFKENISKNIGIELEALAK
jgi:hypothetical protein